MRCLQRNMRTFYYAAYEGKEAVMQDGLRTGETRVLYSKPVKARGNISPASGQTANEIFGSLEGYDKILMLDNPRFPIDEYSILWIDTLPDEGKEEIPSHDYIVKRVAASLNSVAIAVSKVDVR